MATFESSQSCTFLQIVASAFASAVVVVAVVAVVVAAVVAVVVVVSCSMYTKFVSFFNPKYFLLLLAHFFRTRT